MIPSTAAAAAGPGRFGPPSWGCAPYRGGTCQDGVVFWGVGLGLMVGPLAVRGGGWWRGV